MAIQVRHSGAWVDNTGEKKRVNGAWVSNEPYKVMKPTITGVPPFMFKSDGQNLRDWSMSGQTVQASTPTPANPVAVEGVGTLSGSDYIIPITCGGQTTNIYLNSSTSTRRVKKLVVTGEETGWTLYQLPSGGTVGIYQFYINENIISGVANSSCRCTITPYGITSQNRGNYVYGAYLVNSGRSIALQMKGSEADFPTVDAFKTYLAQQYANGTPVTVWYLLATPEVAATNEPLMKIGSYADELTKTGIGVDIPTTNGSNTLTVGTTVQPSEMTIESISQWV